MKLFYNANLYQHDEDAFVVQKGRFVAFGSYDALKKNYPVTEEKDLQGGYVYPGFNDSHMHLLNLGSFLSTYSLYEHTSSLKDLKDYLKEEVSKLDKDAFVTGRGFNQDYFEEKRMLTREDLDEVSLSNPIILTRACGHICILNSKAIEVLHLNDLGIVEGGEYDLKEGIFKENALMEVMNRMEKPSFEEVKRLLVLAMKKANSFGITSVQTDDFETLTGMGYQKVIDAYRELDEEGKMTLRVYEQCQLTKPETLKKFINEGNVNRKVSEHFTLGPLKLLGDGSLGAHTAKMREPYVDEKDNCGLSVFTQQQFDELIEEAHKNSMQIAIHSIGDGCLDMLLQSFEKAIRKYPREDHRHGIVHCQITHPQQLEKMKELGLVCYAQTIFIDYDSRIVLDRVSEELAKTSYNFKTLMKMGVNVSNGSDCPVEMCDCLRGMQCGITRCSIGSDKPYLPEQAFTVEEAIDSFTINGAYQSFEEKEKGLLKEGYLADFVCLDQDIAATKKDSIHDIKVLQTYLSGNAVYEKA